MPEKFTPQPTPENSKEEVWLNELDSKKTRDYIFAQILNFRTRISREDAEDAVQQTMLNATKAIRAGQFYGDAKLTTWLYRIAKNATIDLLREKETLRHTQTIPLSDVHDLSGEGPSSLDKYMSAEEARNLRSYFDKLTPKLRQLMELMADGLSPTEIAKRLNTNFKTVNNRYWRARQILKERMKDIDKT
ncbi:MAG: Terminase, ATPase subunit, gpP-like protein [Candidatus Magasanikbacteria bacterium GW2011_GWA2_40_10]|uniref:Terminase, ATPase subunit, gpP-like protein n=1 Tax=Candidatus Magasanikbacteria bacterium GW2011_GWA2_40_10 TaxID=1619037 RepID=A0A0G0Q1Z8_9BACT|nr:MAG: Terminase, ATPase subunit, gpP-like protein [Candidatus Magasanikbacteria bacterium GW2011_GWA2_40_10]